MRRESRKHSSQGSQHPVQAQAKLQRADLEFAQDTATVELLSTLQHVIVLQDPGANLRRPSSYYFRSQRSLYFPISVNQQRESCPDPGSVGFGSYLLRRKVSARILLRALCGQKLVCDWCLRGKGATFHLGLGPSYGHSGGIRSCMSCIWVSLEHQS